MKSACTLKPQGRLPLSILGLSTFQESRKKNKNKDLNKRNKLSQKMIGEERKAQGNKIKVKRVRKEKKDRMFENQAVIVLSRYKKRLAK